MPGLPGHGPGSPVWLPARAMLKEWLVSRGHRPDSSWVTMDCGLGVGEWGQMCIVRGSSAWVPVWFMLIGQLGVDWSVWVSSRLDPVWSHARRAARDRMGQGQGEPL